MAFSMVAGISSSGKSTFIDTQPSKETVLACAITDMNIVRDNSILHYNTLRYAENKLENASRSYLHDNVLRLILEDSRLSKIDYMFCGRQELLGRISSRKTIENGLGRYPSSSIFNLVESLNYQDFNRQWISIFENSMATLRLIYAHEDRFCEVSLSEFQEIVGQD